MMAKLPLTFAMALFMAVALAGCAGLGQPRDATGSAAAPVPAAAMNTSMGQCNAQPAQFAVGQNSTAVVVESARSRSGAKMARILRPGQMVTREFDAQRLNLEVDGNGQILVARCG